MPIRRSIRPKHATRCRRSENQSVAQASADSRWLHSPGSAHPYPARFALSPRWLPLVRLATQVARRARHCTEPRGFETDRAASAEASTAKALTGKSAAKRQRLCLHGSFSAQRRLYSSRPSAANSVPAAGPGAGGLEQPPGGNRDPCKLLPLSVRDLPVGYIEDTTGGADLTPRYSWVCVPACARIATWSRLRAGSPATNRPLGGCLLTRGRSGDCAA
jgi:hypothetical protein